MIFCFECCLDGDLVTYKWLSVGTFNEIFCLECGLIGDIVT